jgi:hypothetical protein
MAGGDKGEKAGAALTLERHQLEGVVEVDRVAVVELCPVRRGWI